MKYLGVPLSSNTITNKECGNLVTKIKEKLNGWRSRLLFFAGRAELVHTVIFAKVRFWIQTFQIPDCSIENIDSVCAKFIWRGGLQKSAMIFYADPNKKGESD